MHALAFSPLATASSPRAAYQVVVVGSGYGGAILAARLAEKNVGVAIFERGREWAPSALPSSLGDAAGQVRSASNPLGLFDYRKGDDVDVLSGSGLGGSSLINANVALRAPVEVFESDRWPTALRGAAGRSLLDPYYDVAEQTLGVTSTPDALALGKVRAREQAAQKRGLKLLLPKLTIDFNGGCVRCGECIVGCRTGAKNTLTQNYLKVARQHGAEIVTQTEVRFVVRHPQGGWEVHALAHPAGGGPPIEHVVRASAVVIAAGSLGSTGILLRSRDRGLGVGRRLGHHFGGNADRAGYGYNTDTFIGAIGRGTDGEGQPVGPTIASMTVHFDEKGRSFLIQDGAVPSQMVLPTRLLLSAAAVIRGEDTDGGIADEAREAARMLRDAVGVGDKGALAHTLLMLAMGDDDADGRVILDEKELPRVVWGGLADKPIFRTMDREMRALVADLGGTWVSNPNPWRGFGGPPMTVHPLGGVPMGDDVDRGVVDHLGRVFSPEGALHDGLFVTDGSIVPSSLRVNPLLTIAALAERIAGQLDAKSFAPVATPTPPQQVPAPPIGIGFTEVMTGWIERHPATLATQKEPIAFRLTITASDLDKFLADPDHEATAEGHIDSPWGSKRLVEAATFNLLVDGEAPDTKKTLYALDFEAEDGTRLRLEGEKRIHDDPGYDSFGDATTLFITIRRGWAPNGPAEAQGVMKIGGADLLRQITTFRAHRAPTWEEGARALGRFGAFFFGNLWEPFLSSRLTSPPTD